MPVSTEIITIGDEILIGQTVDTNSAWLGEHLNARGFSVVQITSITDQPLHIRQALDQALERADLVLLTGGLGPTSDDRTKQTLADYFDMPLKENAGVLQHIRQLLGANRVPLNPLNIQQALLPEGCTVLNNRAGTAAGMLFRLGKKVVVSMPGVPYEMKSVCENELFPWLDQNLQTQPRIFKMVMTTGYPESVLAGKLEPWERQLPSDFSIAYLPSPGIVKLRISCTCDDLEQVESMMNEQIARLTDLIPEAVYSTKNERLEETVGRLLVEKGQTMVTAESCTGGKIGQLITSVPGSSEYFLGGIIAYDNVVKKNLLQVDQRDLLSYGAVSEPVVRQMANSARLLFGADYAVATSGIAGPDGGSESKPVGLNWVAVASPYGTFARIFQFGNHRGRNITRTSMASLNMLRLVIQQDFQNLKEL